MLPLPNTTWSYANVTDVDLSICRVFQIVPYMVHIISLGLLAANSERMDIYPSIYSYRV